LQPLLKLLFNLSSIRISTFFSLSICVLLVLSHESDDFAPRMGHLKKSLYGWENASTTDVAINTKQGME